VDFHSTEGIMQANTPPHPGELVGDRLGELGWTMVDAAKGLGISRQQLHNIVSGRSAVTPLLAVKLERALGASADTWLSLQNAYDLARLQQHGGADIVERFTPRPALHTIRAERH
jgi:addiction module HigA family antidote